MASEYLAVYDRLLSERGVPPRTRAHPAEPALAASGVAS
jgi:hypothetical protein